MTPSTPGIPLADFIDAVRLEIEESRWRAQQRNMRFEVANVKLEVELTATGSSEAEGGIKLWAISVSGTAGRSAAVTHRVTLDLTALNPDGTKVKVSDIANRPIPRT